MVVSIIKWARFLVDILSPLARNEYTIDNTFSFVQELSSLRFGRDVYMCSFDVVSLFTNIPLDETISFCTRAASSDVRIQTSINESYLTQLLNLCTKDSVFVFEEKLYKQNDGVAMGSPLGPLLANVFMCFSESKWLDDCPSSFKPLYYRRYVDDTFVLFRSRDHVQPFLQYLNTRHPNIQFTCDTEKDGILPFLDVNVRRDDVFHTSVYRKPTFTGLFSNFKSFLPLLYKINLAKCLFNRAFKICSSHAVVDKEFKNIVTLLLKNGFSSDSNR